MCRSNVKTAILVSSLTFGMGHIVNLLLGAPLLDTLLQLVYASAIGFCYTAIFCAGGSIVPCILSHAFVNSTSVFAVEPSGTMHILITILQTVFSVSYGLWLLRGMREKITK
jgi:membrane protease YdiL (CAAX protease family)